MAIEIVKGNLNTPKAGAGAPNFTNARPLYAIPQEYLEENGFPAVDELGVRTLGDFNFKEGGFALKLYLTSSTKDYSVETTGDQDAERFKLKVVGNYPGDETEATEFAVNNLGKPFILVAGKCETGGKSKIIGDICNPLYLSPTFTANKDKTGFIFTWEQSEGSRYMHREYSGVLPTEDSLTPVLAATAVQFLEANPNAVKIAQGSAASVIAVTSVTKASGQTVTLIGQDTVVANAGTLSNGDAADPIVVLLAGGTPWVSVSGSTISFRVFKDGSKTYLFETART